MIAAVKGWPAAFSALLFFLPPGAIAADDPAGAAHELARKTAALAGRGEAVITAWRNLSSLGSAELARARAAFESAFREGGGRLGDAGPVEAHFTLSENRMQYLLVEEIRKGADRQVWIASWNRARAPSLTPPAITLDRKLVWEQEDPIFDVAFPSGGMLVLSPSKIAFIKPGALPLTVALSPSRPFPRDPRGHLRTAGNTFQAYLPGLLCSGTLDPSLSMDCKPSDEPWVIESGSRTLLLATYTSTRNHFDGRVITQNGQRKALAPFYSAATVEDQGRTQWLLAMVDGRTQIFDAALDPISTLTAPWGSDIAGTDSRCGGRASVLATRPGDAGSPDAVQAFSIVDRAAMPLTAPAELSGPVVALWYSAGNSAVAIVRNLATGKYEAYTITIACS